MSKIKRTLNGGLYPVLPIELGGTNANNPTDSLYNLGGVPLTSRNQPNGVLGLDELGKIDLSLIPNINTNYLPALSGPLTIASRSSADYTITNFDSSTSYVVNANKGTIVINGGIVTYTAPTDTDQSIADTAIIYVNGRELNINIIPLTMPITPSITMPILNSPSVDYRSMVLVSGPFAMSVGNATHITSDWQVATDPAFTNKILDIINSTVNLTTATKTDALPSTVYYARVRYKDNTGVYSNWSNIVSFTTMAEILPAVATPSITAPTNGATNQSVSSINFTASAFTLTQGTDTHLDTEWQISVNSSFSSLFANDNNLGPVTSWTKGGFTNNTTYYVRMRYKTTRGVYSSWSNYITFTTIVQTVIATPTISVSSTTTYSIAVTLSAFQVTSGVDTYANTEWYRNGSLVATTVGGTSYTYTDLSSNTSYNLTARHKSNSNVYSSLSTAVSGATQVAYTPYGTFHSYWCSGYTKYAKYHDGAGGFYDVVVEYNSTYCGYVAPVPVNISYPVISGSALIGSTLTASTGTWSNSPTSYFYQWTRNGVNIFGATSSTYTVMGADYGTVLRVKVNAVNASGVGVGTSNPTATVNTDYIFNIAGSGSITNAALPYNILNGQPGGVIIITVQLKTPLSVILATDTNPLPALDANGRLTGTTPLTGSISVGNIWTLSLLLPNGNTIVKYITVTA